MATIPGALPPMEAPGSSADAWNSSFDKAFGDGGDAAPAEDTAAVDEEQPVADEAPVDAEPEAEQPVAEDVPTEEQPEQAEPELVDESDELKPDKVSPDGKTLHFRKEKAARLFAARDFQKNVLAAVPNATPEVIADHYKTAVFADMMVSDFNSGDPDRVGKFANFWVGREANPNAVAGFLDTVSRLAPQAHPQAWQVIEQRATAGLIEGLYQKSMTTQGESSDFLLKLAQNLEYHLTGGRFRQREQLGAQGKPSRESELEAQLNEYKQRGLQERQQRADNFMKDLDASVDKSMLEEIEKALEPVAKQFKSTPQWKYIVGDLKEHVSESRKAAQTWDQQFNHRRNEARGTLSGESKDALQAMMRQFTKSAIASQLKKVIEAHTGTVMQKNAAAHKAAQQTAARTEPAGSQAPVQRHTHKQKLQEAKTADEKFAISFGRAFGNG